MIKKYECAYNNEFARNVSAATLMCIMNSELRAEDGI
jgi:hypothetical protein